MIALSDDLTGAVACAGELRRAGASPTVVGWELFSPARDVDSAVVINTASRLLPSAEAADRIKAVLRRLGDTGPVYKRIDSRLRGPFGAELNALSCHYGAPCVIAPAAPEFGITTVDGIQRAGSIRPIDEQHVSYDEPSFGAVRELLHGTVAELDLDAVRNPDFAHALAAAVRTSDHVVCDSESLDDLAIVAEALRSAQSTTPMIPVGSYGFAAHVSRPVVIDTPVVRGVLTVVATCDEVSRQQVTQAGRCGMIVQRWNVGDGLGDLERRLGSGWDVILTTCCPGEEVGDTVADSTFALKLATALSEEDALRALDRLILVGGELCGHLARLAKTTAIVIEAEPWPATPIVRFRGGAGDGLLGILKSGGRGGPNWIIRAADVLRGWA